jgi:hypothetical protein
MKFSLIQGILLHLCFFTISCNAYSSNNILELEGSTPGDAAIKSIFKIAERQNVDFMQWKLNFFENGHFELELRYGISKPNTLGFENGGTKKMIKGTYHIEKGNTNSRFSEVYKLEIDSTSNSFSIAKITDNVFHIINQNGGLFNGNGGWSYSLFTKIQVKSEKIYIKSPTFDDTSLQMTFDGRTPCQAFAQVHAEMNASPSCFKLKWRLVLNRNSILDKSGTCEIRNIVDNQPRNITGKWEKIDGTEADLKVSYIKVSVNNLSKPILFLIADENVLLFIHPDLLPFVGNENFGFALNRKSD